MIEGILKRMNREEKEAENKAYKKFCSEHKMWGWKDFTINAKKKAENDSRKHDMDQLAV